MHNFFFGSGGFLLVLIGCIGLYLQFKKTRKPIDTEPDEPPKVVARIELINQSKSDDGDESLHPQIDSAEYSDSQRKSHSQFVSALIENSPSDDKITTKKLTRRKLDGT